MHHREQKEKIWDKDTRKKMERQRPTSLPPNSNRFDRAFGGRALVEKCLQPAQAGGTQLVADSVFAVCNIRTGLFEQFYGAAGYLNIDRLVEGAVSNEE